MQKVIYLLLRRMRLPLIVLVSTYAISIAGLTLIPGMDDQGNPWRMDFFHATYFVSFLGSTIGFGEIPYPFTAAQRLWTMVIIYAAVVSWLYAIGSILTLVQDQGFRRVLARSALARKVRRNQEPFFIICGYGDAGSWLVRELNQRHMQCVVIDSDQDKILNLEVEDLAYSVPALHADATEADSLTIAGLKLGNCIGVIGLTGSDTCNLTIAITSKLLAPEIPVICQSDSEDMAANMASFGTNHIVDPFDIFGKRFAMMFHSPSMYLVYEWMTGTHNAPLSEFRSPPHGNWILCGYGRFGQAVRRHLAVEGVDTRIIEADIQRTGAPEGSIEGRGTEAGTLILAGIESVDGIIAGTDGDTNNLSILITAHDLNPDLFTVIRQNHQSNDAIFQSALPDLVMQPGTIAAQYILNLILAPLLEDFLSLAHDRDDAWANVLVSRVAGVVEDIAPETWAANISPMETPAVFDCLIRGEPVRLSNICSDPRDRELALPCVPLLIKRDEGSMLLPEMDELLSASDQILFCGREEARYHLEHNMRDHQALYYSRTGDDRPSGAVWRFLTRHVEQNASH
ncbi:Potassium channel protein [hydrothermal vent metagenome]|uniref:Potassium channel protein n=1 Tax=hydrothermal vent metagenome TaxID=652676 RepID=A0A3B0YHM0_9ZZZZ